MQAYIVRRLAEAIFVVFGVSLVVFMVLHLTGDPVSLLLPETATEADITRLRHDLGLDQPLHVQYARFVGQILHGDFGYSLYYTEPALPVVLRRLPATLQLTLAAMFIVVFVAIPAGVLAAIRRGSMYDNVAMLGVLLFQSMPVFWLGIMLILAFSVSIKIFPSSGSGSGIAGIRYLVLPALTLGLYSTARLARVVRAGMLDVLSRDYIRTAHSKGLRERVVIVRHALKNSLLPVITLLGMEIGTMLGGAVITETVFAWPGIGRLVVTAIYQRDYALVQAAVIVIAFIYVFVNLVVDIAYTFVDPRIRYE